MAVCRERGGFRAGSVNEVQDALQRRLRENELDADAAMSLGDIMHLVRGDSDAAALLFERVLENDPRNVRAMSSYALILLRDRRDYARAELLVSRVLMRQPHHVLALELQAWLELHVHRRLDRAREICERSLGEQIATQAMPRVSLSLLRTYASVLLRQGQPMCAAAVLETVLQLDPHDIWTLRRLAQVLQDRDLGVSELLQMRANHLAGSTGSAQNDMSSEDAERIERRSQIQRWREEASSQNFSDESSEVGPGAVYVEVSGEARLAC